MNPEPSHVLMAGLGPFVEVIGVVAIVALFTLLRDQADRRPYFKAWEEGWVMLAVSLTAGVIYQRLTDPTSVLLSASRATTWIFAATYFSFRLMALALMVHGTRMYTRGDRNRRLVTAAAPVGLALTLFADTFRTPLGGLSPYFGPFVVLATAYAAWQMATLPKSRQSAGSSVALWSLAGVAALWSGLVLFGIGVRTGSVFASNPWFVRFERYGFFLDLIALTGVAYAMVQLLFEDARRDNADAQSHVNVLHDRKRLAKFHDDESGLLSRRAFEEALGLDFAMASFGSVARIRVTNHESLAAEHGKQNADAMLAHFAAVLSSGTRAHDWVFRWNPTDFLVVMPRAVPPVALNRLNVLLARAAPFAISGVRDAVRADTTLAVEPFSGAEDLTAAAKRVMDDHVAP